MRPSGGPYAQPQAVAALARRVSAAAEGLDRPVTFMEVCGTHTHAIARTGVRDMLPASVRLVSGPGCPVCVTPVEYLDRAIALAHRPGTVVATFGDLMRVPSSTVSLEVARARGASVQVVYSPRDALELAAADPNQDVVFLAVGFETTTPPIAAALTEAEDRGIANFFLLPGNKVMPPPMRVLVDDPDLRIDGFILPGHVSVITGWHMWRFLPNEHGAGGVVCGFTPTDVLRGVAELLSQVMESRPRIRNLYSRVVTPGGNRTAQRLVASTFEPADAGWRGFGVIPGSGMSLREAWRHRDAGVFPVELPPPLEPPGCRCGDVLRGIMAPPQCPLFDRACTPDTPVGACMVSSEGSCAAWHRHERWALGGAS